MKKAPIATGLVLLMVFVSCNSGKKNTVDNENFTRQTESLDGLWLSEGYLNRIEKSKSICQNADYAYDTLEWFGFSLNKKNLQTDSACLFGFTVHEGGYDNPLVYDPEKGKFVNNLKALTEESAYHDPFELAVIDSNTVEIYFEKTNTRERYHKLKDDIENELMGRLIAGEYVNTKNKNEIRFDPDGKVHNFNDFVSYELLYDYDEMMGLDFDAITLLKKNDKWNEGTTYKYTIKGDHLYLQLVQTGKPSNIR